MGTKNEAPYAEFGAKLMALRKDAGMTRSELGQVCGVAQSTIVNYERGLRIPYADTAVKFADFFHISVHDLLCVDDPDAEMLAAEMSDTAGDAMSARAKARAQKSLRDAAAVLGAGGLSPEDRKGYILTMQRLMLDASLEATDTYTPYSIRGEDWEEKKKQRHADAENARRAIEDKARELEE
jgi:transcriptional regulator with XRE-family HTH domain